MKSILKNKNGNSMLTIIWIVILCIVPSIIFNEITSMYEDMGITSDQMFNFKISDIVLLIVSGLCVAFMYKKLSKEKSNIICSLIIITWILFFLLGSMVMKLYTVSFLFDAYGM